MKLAPLIPAPTQSLTATIAAIVQLHELRWRDEIAEVQTSVDRVRWYTPAEYVAMVDGTRREVTELGWNYGDAP